ncbi:MAG: RHS repeat-associated core domain-containing protein, partial [Candidatus Riflebacteria bacterium]|nr:RHS repeat-associated core domain-containing protein [Candidatus Riflebacteria bacterium]
ERPDGSVEDVEEHTYDVSGNRLTSENAAVKVTSVYDRMNLETKRTVVYKKTGATRMLTFFYDVMGRRQLMATTHGRVVSYSYDKLSRPTEIKFVEPASTWVGLGQTFRARSYRFSSDATSNLTQVDYPNQTRTRRSFDAINRLTEMVHERVENGRAVKTLASWKYQREAKARGSKKDENETDEEEAEERLLRAEDITYTYDPAGNRTEENRGGQVIRSTFSATNELLTRDRISYRYDDRGNQVEKRFPSGQIQSFAYNVAGQLVGFAKGREQKRQVHLDEVERYLYSSDNERVGVEEVAGKKFTHFLWDGSRPIEEWQEIGKGAGKKDQGLLYARDLGGQLLDQVRYTRFNGRSSPDLDKCGQDPDIEDDDAGPPIGQLRYLRFVMPDHLGSSSLIANGHGRRLDRLIYGPWGEKLTGKFERTRFGYTGHSREARTGYWYSMWRYLDTRAGRWTQRDPIQFVDGPNMYWYVLNNPIRFADGIGFHATTAGQKCLFKAIDGLDAVGEKYKADLKRCTDLSRGFLAMCKADECIAEATCEFKDKSIEVMEAFTQCNRKWRRGLSTAQIRAAATKDWTIVTAQKTVDARLLELIRPLLEKGLDDPSPAPAPTPNPKCSGK